MPPWAQAGLWGAVAGAALVLGAGAGYYLRVPQRVTALVMAFGAGVLISALAFDLMDEAFRTGGLPATSAGFVGGAAAYTAANWLLSRRGAHNRKRSNGDQPSEAEAPGSGLAMFVGALLDGIPESIAVGVSLLGGRAVSAATVAAIFLSNLPEGLSAAAGMRRGGRSPGYVFGLHGAVVLASALAALLGYAVFGRFPPAVVAATTAVAAGAVLAMIADTMMPEAYEEARSLTGVVTVLGFLAAFALEKAGAG